MLGDWISGGQIADVILAVLFIEALLLSAYRLSTGRGISIAAIAANLLAGACLVIALRIALTGGPMHWLLLSLAAGLAAHIADLIVRWR